MLQTVSQRKNKYRLTLAIFDEFPVFCEGDDETTPSIVLIFRSLSSDAENAAQHLANAYSKSTDTCAIVWSINLI